MRRSYDRASILRSAHYEELVDHYQAVNDAVPLPIMVYNIPAHSKVNLTPEVLARLVEIPTSR